MLADDVSHSQLGPLEEKGKKYRLALSAGKDPMSELVYKTPRKVPDDAFAIDDDGRLVKPRVIFGKATPEQKAAYSIWQTPVVYLRHQETFLGTKRQAQAHRQTHDWR